MPSHRTCSLTQSPCHSPYRRPSLRHSSPQSGLPWCKWPDMFYLHLISLLHPFLYAPLSFYPFLFVVLNSCTLSDLCNLHPLLYFYPVPFSALSPAFNYPNPSVLKSMSFRGTQQRQKQKQKYIYYVPGPLTLP